MRRFTLCRGLESILFRVSQMETNDPVVKRIPPGLRPWFVIGAGVTIQFTYGIVYTFGKSHRDLALM